MYSFLFDRKSLTLLVAGLATVGCLLFFAGLLTGVFWGIPGSAPAAPGAAQAATPAAFLPSLPCRPAAQSEELGDEPKGEPVPLEAPETESPREPKGAAPQQVARLQNGLEDDPADQPFAEPSRSPAPELDPAQAEASNLARASSPQPAAKPAPAIPAAAPPTAKSEETKLASTAAPLPEPSVPQEPLTETVSAAKPAVLRTALYSLQIGAFRKAENSSRIVQDLQSRGYDAYVVQEKGGRVILTVRVGRFAERDEALRAAEDFRRREGKAVIVRSLSSLPATSW